VPWATLELGSVVHGSDLVPSARTA
jgi:hypothetical protein